MSIKIKTKINPKSIQIQGKLLFDKTVEKYDEFERTKELLKILNTLFQKKGNKFVQSTTNDEIYYFNKNIEDSIKILKEI
jgi:hypothetical protein